MGLDTPVARECRVRSRDTRRADPSPTGHVRGGNRRNPGSTRSRTRLRLCPGLLVRFALPGRGRLKASMYWMSSALRGVIGQVLDDVGGVLASLLLNGMARAAGHRVRARGQSLRIGEAPGRGRAGRVQGACNRRRLDILADLRNGATRKQAGE